MKFKPEHIREVLRQCTVQEYRRGKAWYPKANKWCQLVAVRYGLRPGQVAGILAAMSPQKGWHHNIIGARELIASNGRRSNQMEANANKARAILSGRQAGEVLASGKGHKVRAFFACIENPKDTRAVCLDRHAFAIAAGRVLPAATLAKLFRGQKWQNAATKAYQMVADEYGLLPNELQAITWLTWRRLKNQQEEI